MRLVIFCLLVSFCLCSELRFFRYSNGTFIKGNKSPITVSGSLYYSEDWEGIQIIFTGMDYSTMTPLCLTALDMNTATTGIDKKVPCVEAFHGLEKPEKGLSGTSVLTGSWEKAEFKAECYTKAGDLWVFKSSNVKSQTMKYPPKEAGLRAKFLIDQPVSKYKAQSVILFATLDLPYLNMNCKNFLSSYYPETPGPEPGGVMVGKDGDHCAILDNEATKFIQSNSAEGKVTYNSIAVVERYFPKGVLYKKYPEASRSSLSANSLINL